jgi:hypothetical protein
VASFLALQFQFDGLVKLRSQSLAIWTKCDAIDRIAMPGEGSNLFGFAVPQFNGLVS